MLRIPPAIVTTYLLATLALLSACSETAPEPQLAVQENHEITAKQTPISLKFGVYTSEKPTTLVTKFRPILDRLEKTMAQMLNQPVSISMLVAPSYEKGIANIAKAKVDFARLGPASYIEAKRQNKAISILVSESKKGRKTFNGIICTHKDSDIDSINDIKGKRFAFGNKRSTIGRYLSQAYLLQHNIRSTDLQQYEYLGRHDKVGTAVGLKQFDAGALREGTFNKLVKKGTPIKTLASFPNVTQPWIARQGIPAPIKKALTQALLQLTDVETLKGISKDGFLNASDHDYDIIRKAIQNNGAFFN